MYGLSVRRRLPRAVAAVVPILGLLLVVAPGVQAAGGDFAVTDFAAAAPFTYDHATGGGAFNDRTVGDFDDITEQLEGGEFACRDIVTFLAQFEITAAPVDATQVAEFEFLFLANSTGQPGAALADILHVGVNYGPVENGDGGSGTNPGAGSFGLDSGISDDGGSTATLIDEWMEDGSGTRHPDSPDGANHPLLYTNGATLHGTVRLDDLEASEKVVVRIDALITCQPGSSPTGNLQGQLDAGRVVEANGTPLPTPDVINTGQQTIPFIKIGELIGAGEPLLSVSKTVTTASGTCGVDDGETLTIALGETVKYCYLVTNAGTATLFDLVLTDDNGTPADTADDFAVTLTGLADLDGEGDAPDLVGGGTTRGEALVTPPAVGTLVNTSTAVGNNGLAGGNFAELTASDTATVVVEAPAPTPAISITKVAQPQVARPGDTITYTYAVTNTGGVELTNITVVDDVLGPITLAATTLAPGASTTGTATHTVGAGDLPGPIVNTAVATGTDPQGGTVQASDSETVPLAALAVDKTVSAITATVGDTVFYTYRITNIGSAPITNLTLTDDKLGAIALPVSSLAPGEATLVTVEYVITAADAAAPPLVNVGTAAGTAPDGAPVTAQDTAEIPTIVLQAAATTTIAPAATLPKTGPYHSGAAALGVAVLALGGLMLLSASTTRRSYSSR